ENKKENPLAHMSLSEIEKMIEPLDKIDFTMTIGYSYSRSGNLGFRRYLVKAWFPINGKYYEVKNPDLIVEIKNKEWTRNSRTKNYGEFTFSAPVGTIIKVLEDYTAKYYLVTKEGLKELENEAEKVIVASGRPTNPAYKYYIPKGKKVDIWYYKNKVFLPDGSVIEDVEDNPKLYSNMSFYQKYYLSDLEALKDDIRLVEEDNNKKTVTV
ncbi:MAG: hypothetical protein QW575_08555, partial [Thermoproteota archaeon]